MVINDSHIEAAMVMSPRARGAFLSAIAEYVALGTEPQGLPREAAAAWVIAKKDIDNAAARAEAGRRGGHASSEDAGEAEAGRRQAPSKPEATPQANPKQTSSKGEATTQANPKQSGSNPPSKTEANTPLIEKEIEKEKKTLRTGGASAGAEDPAPPTGGERRPRFRAPTVEEVREYASSRGYTFSPEAFVAHYDSNGWKVGRNPMRDWHAACVTWQQREPGGMGAARPAGAAKTDEEIAAEWEAIYAEMGV